MKPVRPWTKELDTLDPRHQDNDGRQDQDDRGTGDDHHGERDHGNGGQEFRSAADPGNENDGG
jgi:hypothetical protein